MTRWTAADVPDQHGRTVVVTGANSGLGAEVTRVLAGAGATVIMACRDPARAHAIADSVDGCTEVRRLDLADLSSVQAVRIAHTDDHAIADDRPRPRPPHRRQTRRRRPTRLRRASWVVSRDVISDVAWLVISPLFPRVRSTGRPPVDRRMVVEATALRAAARSADWCAEPS